MIPPINHHCLRFQQTHQNYVFLEEIHFYLFQRIFYPFQLILLEYIPEECNNHRKTILTLYNDQLIHLQRCPTSLIFHLIVFLSFYHQLRFSYQTFFQHLMINNTYYFWRLINIAKLPIMSIILVYILQYN